VAPVLVYCTTELTIKIKHRCLLYHFIIVFGDTLTYNDIHAWGHVREHYIILLCRKSMKVNIDYHTVVNHCLQYSNSVYVSLVVRCFSVLMVKLFA
jgi:hypothetical protein